MTLGKEFFLPAPRPSSVKNETLTLQSGCDKVGLQASTHVCMLVVLSWLFAIELLASMNSGRVLSLIQSTCNSLYLCVVNLQDIWLRFQRLKWS